MEEELAYNFLYFPDKFIEQFQRVLDRTPHERVPSHRSFWIHFFLGSSITIQNSNIGNNIKDICFSIGTSGNDAKIVKLAFKVEIDNKEKVILRSISISKDDAISEDVRYSKNELKTIASKFWGKKAQKTADTTINLSDVDSKTLHVDIKTSNIKLEDNRELGDCVLSQNTVKVQPLQLGKNAAGEDKTLDDILDIMSDPTTITAKTVKSFFDNLKDAYRNDKHMLKKVEAAYHGFTYGALILNYHVKYGVDAYVEQSAGRGFLDLYFLLRKDKEGNHISNAVKIIVEFKGAQRKGSDSIMSVTDAVKQIEERAYAFQFVGRTESKNVIIVGADFGATGETVQAKMPKTIDLPKQSFISELIASKQIPARSLKHTIEKQLKIIYDSTRSDESLDKVILGDLLSSNVVEKNVFTIKDFPNGQRVSMFVFKNQYQKAVILTCIEQENLASPKYVRVILKDPSKPAIRANIKEHKQITIEQEVNDGILYIQRELNINSGKRIDITINPKGKVFESIRSADFYCLDIKVNDLGLSSPPAPYISQFITKYDIASSIDLNNLIPALQGLDLEHMSSPPHDDDGDKQAQFREFNKLKEELFNLKGCIVLEKDLKSILHGLFLYKKLNKHDITILAEMSLGHGRADLALIFKDNIPLALELGLGTSETKITQKESQLKNYIKYLKAITDARQANGVVLGFNKDATSADSIIVAKGFSERVDHISSDDSPIRQSLLQSSPNLQDLDNPQPGPSGVQQEKRGKKRWYDADSDSKLNPRQKKLKGSLSSCPDSKKKREISFCKFSAQDLDEFSIKKTRNIDELQIDSKKFLEYLRHSNDQAKNSQLLELAKIRQIEDSDNIIGDYKYLLDRVTEAGGYNNYRQNERLESIMYNIARDTKINNQLKSKLISAAGKMQLIMGIHGTIVQCQESKDSDTGVRDCLLSVGGLTYSLASAPIENIIVKQQSKWGVRLLNSFSQVTPKILGHNTKFIFKILSAKYGVNFFKGTAGVVTGVFDIVDIGLAAQALKKCQDMAGTDNACSNREIRDYTASIIFSGVSFVSGIALAVTSASIGLSVGVGLVLMVVYGLYSGISAIVEYEEKYDTTHDENLRIFWHTVTNQPLPKDVQHLAARTKSVNKILNAAWHHLQSMPDNVVAYAGGFGKVVIKNWEECKESSINRCFAVHGILSCAPPNCKRYSSSTLEPSDANIDMLSPNDGYLSRVLPNYIAGATMTCLPTQSNAIYEASGTGRSDPNVIHSCSNSFVIEHNARRNQVHDNKYIIFNTQLMTTGGITTNYTPSSIFLLGKSSINIHILSRDSQFVFLNNEFSGSIIFDASFLSYYILSLPYPLNKSFNAVFNTAMLDHNIVKFSIQSVEHFDFTQKINVINMFINDRKIKLWSYYHNVIKIAYQGRKNKEDHVDCKLDESHPSVEFDLIDGGGGYSNDRPDIITGCKKVVIWPYTKIKGTEGIYHFYIRTKDVKKENSNSLIDIKGKGTVVFLDTNLLTDCEKITYSKESNTLSLQIKLGANIFYTLSIKNYLGSDGLTHNFNLIDKNSGNVIPKITESTTIISRFELHITTEHSSGQDDFSVEEVKKYYEKVSEKNKDYELYGVVKDKKNYYHFGSKGVDIIIFDEQVTFVKGGEESDIYIVTDNMDVRTIIIDNSSYDMKFDMLMLSSRYDVWLETAGNDLKILIRKEKGYVEKIDYVIIYNYFKDVSYKHLIFVDEKGDAYIPFQGVDNNLRLVSFCSCSISSFVSVITASTTAVIDCELDNIEYYRIQEDLILHSSSSDSPVIIAKQFFDNQAKYNGTKIYQFNYNEQPLDFIGGANRAKDYKQLVQESYNVAIQEYEVDFSRSFNITHNHRMENGKLVPIPVDEQRTGIIIFKDIRPVRVEVTRFADDLVIRDFSYVHTNNSDEQPIVRVKNWFINHDYTISTIEFDLGLDPIRINKWDENTNTIKGDTTLIIMQNKISLAEWMTYNPSICIQTLLSPNYDILYHHWRCIVAINSKDNIIKSYEALGFNSPEEQVTFIENCEFTKDVLLQLKRSISIATEYEHCLGCNRAVLPPPNMGDNVLACKVWHRLILCGYNYTEASQIYDDLSQTLSYNRTIEGIDKILNILGNNSDETDHQRHRRSFNDHENLIISTTNWFKEKVYSFWNMISNFNILPGANAEPINENPNMGITENCYTDKNNEWQNAAINSNHGIAVQYDYVQQQLPLIQYVLHHSRLVPTVKKYGVIGTIKYFIRQCENQLSNWYYHQDTGSDPDKEQFLEQICSCTNWLNELESILIEMRTQLIKSQSSVFVQCVSEKENIAPKHKVLKSYQDSIQDTKDELYQLTVKLQQQKTVTQKQIDEITILVNYTTDLTIDIIDLTNNSVWRQQLLLVDKYGINAQQDAVGERNADINISASGDMDYHVLAYMSHILPDQLVIGSSGV